jgi:hypothetical protein
MRRNNKLKRKCGGILKKQFFFAFCCAIFISVVSSSVVHADALTPEDADFLIRSVSAEYGEISYAARVGVISVIVNRAQSGLYPRTAAGVISTYRNSDGSMRFTEKAITSVDEASTKTWRMTQDAYTAVMSGADVTDGALNFEFIERVPVKLDFDFDDHGEDEYAREMDRRCKKYKLVIDGVGFW